MMPVVLMKTSSSLKREFLIVVSVIVFVIFMPIITLLSVTNIGALADTVSGSNVTNAVPGSGPQNTHLYDGLNYPGDYYAFGNCTYWVFMRRAQVGQPIPNSWGNAATWEVNALFQGYAVDHIPSQDAIMQISNVDGGLGHVAFVEQVDPNGTWHISEMNVMGFDEVDDQTMPASAAQQYYFIHGKS